MYKWFGYSSSVTPSFYSMATSKRGAHGNIFDHLQRDGRRNFKAAVSLNQKQKSEEVHLRPTAIKVSREEKMKAQVSFSAKFAKTLDQKCWKKFGSAIILRKSHFVENWNRFPNCSRGTSIKIQTRLFSKLPALISSLLRRRHPFQLCIHQARIHNYL